MSDAALRRLDRSGGLTCRHLARVGMARVRACDCNGNGNGNGYGKRGEWRVDYTTVRDGCCDDCARYWHEAGPEK